MFNHSDYYKEIELNFDKDALIEENEEINYHPFSSGKKRNSFSDFIPNWLQGPVRNDIIYEYFEVKRIKDIISARTKSNDVNPKFYKQLANTSLPMHRDNGTKCAINIILSNDAAPIIFEDIGAIKYKCALINVSQRHSVPAFPKDRLLIKFSITDLKYEDVYNLL